MLLNMAKGEDCDMLFLVDALVLLTISDVL